MMRLCLVLLSVVLGAGDHAGQESTRGDNAIKKVIQMLSDMQAKAKTEKADEEVAFSKFNQWCKMESEKLSKSIKKGGAEIESLGSSIDKLTDEAKKLGQDIGKLNDEIAKHEADIKTRKNQRAKENKAYVAESTDYAESVSALGRAIDAMSKEDYDRPGSAAALLQVSQSSRLPEKAKDVIAAFMEYSESSDDDGFGDYAAPEANAYEFQSGGIIGTLKSLLDDFRAQKTKCDKEEANAKHAHDMVIMDLEDAVAGAQKDANAKASQKAAHEQKVALDKKEKASTILVKTEDEGTLKDVTAECTQKKFSFDEKQQLRSDEIEAIGSAIKIMSSSDVSSFIESGASAGQQRMSFAQLRSGSMSEAALQGRRHEVHEFITKESMRLRSRSLALLAETLEASPFAKVKGLISDMIEKLMKEANEDAEQEGFCDTEMGKSKATRTQLTEDIDSLSASIEDAKSQIMALTESNAELSQGIADINSAMAEATTMRTEEAKKNKETVSDAEAAIKAVDAAIAVLKDFYTKASEATALVQGGGMAAQVSRGIKMGSDEWDALGDGQPQDKGHKDGMQTFGDTYKGNQDGATGVLAMIDVIRSDFANLASDTKAAEEAGVKAYSDLKVESSKNLAVKSKKMELNEADKAAAQKRLTEDSKDLKSNQEELVAAERYFEKLEAQCIAKGSSYEDRTKARAAEIQSLKEALKMLS